MQKMGEALPSGPDFLALHFDPGKKGFVEKLFLGITVRTLDHRNRFGLSLDLNFFLFLVLLFKQGRLAAWVRFL